MSGDLTQALRTGQSGLLASQQSVDTVARNIANVNTPGYSRKIVNIEQRTLAGTGAGVEFGALTRRLDQGLLDTLRLEAGTLHSTQIEQGMLERVQDLFGSPDSNTSLSHMLSSYQAAVESLAANPADGLQQREVVRAAEDMADLLRQTSDDLQTMRSDADRRISEAVGEVNRNLKAVADLNDKIVRTGVTGNSVADLQDSRDQVLDRLAELLDVRISQRTGGDVVVFTAGGRTLVDKTAVTLSHVPVAQAGADLTFEEGDLDGIYVGDRRVDKDITSEIGAGELAGLIKMRDATLPDLQSSLDELAAQLRDTVNAIHNRGTSMPGLSSMTGSRVFTEPAAQTITFGGTTDTALVLLDDTGQQVRQTTMCGPGGLLGGTTATVSAVATDINGWLGADGTASIVDGRLTIKMTNATRTLALRDQANSTPGGTRQDASIGFNADAAGGSATIDQTVLGFSAFFGLNDFFVDDTSAAVQQSQVLSGSEISPTTLTIRNASGPIGTVAVVAGDTLADIAANLDALSGIDAAVVPDGSGYRLRIAGSDGSPFTVTETGGSWIDQIGLKPASVGVASSLAVRADIVASPGLVARGTLAWDANQAPSGAYTLAKGDASIVQELAAALSAPTDFGAAGRLTATTTDIADYAATLIADASTLAADTQKASSFQEDLVDTLQHKSDSARGVNLDEELSNLTLYQQSYAAAARIIQTIQSMFDTLNQAVS